MKEKNPLENLSDQIAALLQMMGLVEKSVESIDLPPQIYEMIAKLKSDVTLLQELGDHSESADDESSKEDLTPREKHVLEKMQRLSAEIATLKLRLSLSLSSPYQGSSAHEDINKDKKKRKGKDKFKPIGSRKNWKRM